MAIAAIYSYSVIVAILIAIIIAIYVVAMQQGIEECINGTYMHAQSIVYTAWLKRLQV